MVLRTFLRNVVLLSSENERKVVLNKTGTVRITKFKPVRVTTVAVKNQEVLRILSVSLKPWVSSMLCACAILSSVTCWALHYISTLPHKRQDISKHDSWSRNLF